MESALWVGDVRHRRHAPRTHQFRLPLFMVGVDLDELDEVFAGSRLFSTRRPAVAWLRRADHSLGDRRLPWGDAVRAWVGERIGRPVEGRVRLLTNPRTLGLRMNPVSFYYCHDAAGDLAAVVAEVTNTPWDERHLYVVDVARANRRGELFETRFDKEFHVSPFLPLDLEYRWLVDRPDDELFVHMECGRDGRVVFDASLTLERREITPASLRRTLFEHPAMTWRTLGWIYLHAAALWLKRTPFHAHPARSGRSVTVTEPSAVD